MDLPNLKGLVLNLCAVRPPRSSSAGIFYFMDCSTKSMPFRTTSLFEIPSFSEHRSNFSQYSSSSLTRSIVSFGVSLFGRPSLGDIVITSLFVATDSIYLWLQKVKSFFYLLIRSPFIPAHGALVFGLDILAVLLEAIRGRFYLGRRSGGRVLDNAVAVEIEVEISEVHLREFLF